ncbi:hypothetical protein OPW39_08205 [Vibrio europaeus]|uniref:hypothetical protein n=1 Tax=Vibrio europaeus TaxID=300876 RepID=UPI00233ED6FF|nr:hypothetical protein [Vibrio europaeus]MDC5868808.1 hypothetical protein [Vibrio europaeus]
MLSKKLKKYIPQILVGLFVSVAGGVTVSLITDNDAFPLPHTFLDSITTKHMQLNISGDQNSISLLLGDLNTVPPDLNVEGQLNKLEFFLPPKKSVEVHISGQMNKLIIADELKGFVFVQDNGDMTKVIYR